MRKKQTLSIKELLPSALEEIGASRKLSEQHILQAWDKYFGSTIRSFVSRIYVNRGVLYVKINSSVIKNELFVQRESIVKKLNEEVQQDIIRTLIFL
ncbi:MAG: DUF721 domain-containing protein [Paludibacteraceae bacterium]|nr:DUF721 domain-containing protein [Paludibacteraceae bacterium]MBO7316057.1 DUF721 domain-containing protein [Paludibacteraceae bacterium]